MSWSFYPAREGFNRFVTEWDALNRQLYREHPLFDSCFVGPLVEHFATAQDVLAVHRDRNEAVDSMLLLTKRAGLWRTFLPGQTQIPPVLLANADAAKSLLRALPLTAIAVDLLCQDPEYSIGAALHTCRSHRAMPHATTLNIAVSGTFDEYWQARSRGLRQKMRRALKDTAGDGLVPQLEIVADPAGMKDGIARYGAIESGGWKGREGTAIHPNNVQGRFYEDMLMRFAARGRAMIYELRLSGTLAASQLTIANDYMLITLKTTHDESFKAYSPGNLLDYLLLEGEFARQRFKVIEYYTNASVELLRWGTSQRVISHHQLYRLPWLLPVMDRLRGFRTRLSAQPSAGHAETSDPA